MRGLSAIVLCGGEGTRLDGLDKPLVDFLGQPLVERVLQRVCADEIIIVANRNRDRYLQYGFTVVDDGTYRGCGPLAGIAAGLQFASGDRILCVPGDAPHLPIDLALQLLTAMSEHDAVGVVARDRLGFQPLCNVMSRHLLPSLHRALVCGLHSPKEWMMSEGFAQVSFPEWPLWGWSLNTWGEWGTAEQKART